MVTETFFFQKFEGKEKFSSRLKIKLWHEIRIYFLVITRLSFFPDLLKIKFLANLENRFMVVFSTFENRIMT